MPGAYRATEATQGSTTLTAINSPAWRKNGRSRTVANYRPFDRATFLLFKSKIFPCPQLTIRHLRPRGCRRAPAGASASAGQKGLLKTVRRAFGYSALPGIPGNEDADATPSGRHRGFRGSVSAPASNAPSSSRLSERASPPPCHGLGCSGSRRGIPPHNDDLHDQRVGSALHERPVNSRVDLL